MTQQMGSARKRPAESVGLLLGAHPTEEIEANCLKIDTCVNEARNVGCWVRDQSHAKTPLRKAVKRKKPLERLVANRLALDVARKNVRIKRCWLAFLHHVSI